MHWYTYLGGSLFNRTGVLAYPEQTATFIIFGKDTDRDGVYDIIYAKNTTSGQIQYGGEWDAGGVDGSNTSAVIQRALDACPNYSKVLLSSGTYSISQTINVPNTKILEGEGWGTILKAQTSGMTILDLTSGGWQKVKHLKIEGDNKATVGINFNNGTYRFVGAEIIDVYVIRCSSRAIDLTNTDAVKLIDVHVDDCYIGVYSGSNTTFLVIDRSTLNGDFAGLDVIGAFVYMHNTGFNYLKSRGGSYIYLVDCWTEVSSGYNIYGDSSDEKLVLIGGEFKNSADHVIAGTFDTITLLGGVHFDWVPSGKYDINANCKLIYDDSVRWCQGRNPNWAKPLKNSGTATVANGEYIVHGLATSLNIGASNSTVLITPYTTTYDGVPVVVGCDFVNATHIRVSVYWVNGTAITDDAIQIWWQVKYTG